MKILLITSTFPHPGAAHGGGWLTMGWIKHLSRKNDLYLISFIKEEEKSSIPSIKPYFKEIQTIPVLRGWMSRFRRLPMLPRFPYSIVTYRSRTLAGAVEEMIHRNRIDLVQIDHFHMGQYLNKIPDSIPRVILYQDMVTSVLYQQMSICRGMRKYFYYRELGKSRLLERRYAKLAKNVLVLSRKDRLLVDSWDIGVKSYVLPPLLNQKIITKTKKETSPGNLLFLGAMHRQVNQDAALQLKKVIMPRVWEECPEAKCFVVGDAPPDWLKKLSDPRFVVTGFVPSIKPYLSRATLVVVPLRVVGGIIVKILQAMIAGKPVVATRIANAGVGAEDGKETLLADQPEGLVRHIIALLKDPLLAEKIGVAGRNYVEKNFEPESMKDRIDRIYQEIRLS